MPGRKTRGGDTVRSSTVDSMPTWDWPPSTIREILSPSCANTCPALVGETRLDTFALGAASGKPHSRITAWMNGWPGQRTPTVGPPAVTMPGISSARARTSVNGPGQNARASFSGARRPVGRTASGHFDARDVDNNRIVRRPALDLENFCDRLYVQRVGGQAVNRFRRQRHDFAGAQQFRRAFYRRFKQRRRVRGQNFSGHALFIAQGVDGVELRRLPSRVKSGDDADDGAGNERDGNPEKRGDGWHVFDIGDTF